MRPETLAVHAGRTADPTGAIVPPIHPSVTFERDPDGQGPYLYARLGSPTRDALEACLSALEGGVAAAAFSSGSAATAAVLRAVAAGRVVATSDLYHGTRHLLQRLADPLFVDSSRLPDAVDADTRLVWVETPSNPLLAVCDIAAVARAAREVGALVVVDNTVAPVIQRPLELGADLVVYSTTKYVGGHSDVVGGAVVAAAQGPVFAALRDLQRTEGAVPSPFDCWLLLRGIRTLPHRMRAQSASAAQVAEFLASHPRVSTVLYPGLAGHPGHEIAARQMSVPGALLSFRVRGGREAALAVAGRTRLILRATSLGGFETLIEHRASVEGPGSPVPDDLLRLSVGLEHPEDLIADLAQALG